MATRDNFNSYELVERLSEQLDQQADVVSHHQAQSDAYGNLLNGKYDFSKENDNVAYDRNYLLTIYYMHLADIASGNLSPEEHKRAIAQVEEIEAQYPDEIGKFSREYAAPHQAPVSQHENFQHLPQVQIKASLNPVTQTSPWTTQNTVPASAPTIGQQLTGRSESVESETVKADRRRRESAVDLAARADYFRKLFGTGKNLSDPEKHRFQSLAAYFHLQSRLLHPDSANMPEDERTNAATLMSKIRAQYSQDVQTASVMSLRPEVLSPWQKATPQEQVQTKADLDKVTRSALNPGEYFKPALDLVRDAVGNVTHALKRTPAEVKQALATSRWEAEQEKAAAASLHDPALLSEDLAAGRKELKEQALLEAVKRAEARQDLELDQPRPSVRERIGRAADSVFAKASSFVSSFKSLFSGRRPAVVAAQALGATALTVAIGASVNCGGNSSIQHEEIAQVPAYSAPQQEAPVQGAVEPRRLETVYTTPTAHKRTTRVTSAPAAGISTQPSLGARSSFPAQPESQTRLPDGGRTLR